MLRERLPNRRFATTFDIVAGALRYTTTVGYYPDGRIGEIFLDASKAGSDADSAARDSAITASIAMQFGANIETIRKALCPRRLRHGSTSPSHGTVRSSGLGRMSLVAGSRRTSWRGASTAAGSARNAARTGRSPKLDKPLPIKNCAIV